MNRMNLLLRVMASYTVLPLACILTVGCAWIKPTTEISFSPLTRTISIFNTKDVDLTFKKMDVSWTADGGALVVKDFALSDKSSPVIEANVEQMLAFAEQQRAANEGIIGSLNAIADMVGIVNQMLMRVLPGSSLELETPYGGGRARLGAAATSPAP